MDVRIGDTIRVLRAIVFAPQSNADVAAEVDAFRRGEPSRSMRRDYDLITITPDLVAYALKTQPLIDQ